MVADPHALFDAWLAEARGSEPNDAEAMTLLHRVNPQAADWEMLIDVVQREQRHLCSSGAGQIGFRLPPVGMAGAAWLSTIVSSTL